MQLADQLCQYFRQRTDVRYLCLENGGDGAFTAGITGELWQLDLGQRGGRFSTATLSLNSP
jgi:hypothetical protein